MQLFAYQGNYPINALRNAALNAITTSHVLVVDVDFFPSTELHEAILAQSLYLKNHPRSALVVPAFQRKGNWRGYSDKRWKRELSKPDFIPETFAQLLDCLASVACIVFDFTWNRDAHGTTNTADWVEATAKAAATRAMDAADRIKVAEAQPSGKDAPKLPEGLVPFASYVEPRRSWDDRHGRLGRGHGESRVNARRPRRLSDTRRRGPALGQGRAEITGGSGALRVVRRASKNRMFQVGALRALRRVAEW